MFLLLFVQMAFGQMKKGDRYFDSGDYIRASEIYEGELKKNDSKEILEKLSDCYFNIYKYEDGLRVMAPLVTGVFKETDKYYDNRFNFMYSQFLFATGDYEKAINYLVLFKNNRGIKPPDKEEAREEVETFRLKESDFKIMKMAFNSEASDFGAVKLNDTVYFSSDRGDAGNNKYGWTHRAFLDIYKFPIGDKLEPLREPVPMTKTINSPWHEGSFCFSKDGNTLYISRSNMENGKAIFDKEKNNKVQLYISHKVNNKWGEPVKLPFNQDDYNYEHPVLSPDGKRLYFASDELGSIGGFDIYYVTVNDDGTYGTLRNLSSVINTENREQFPYIDKDGNLFFASNGHLGLGMLDVFVSRWVNGKFTKPINLGSPINSRYDDFSMRYYDDKNGFFTSNRDRDNDDIYSFEQIGEIFEREYINQFEVRDKDSMEYVPNASVKVIFRKKTVYQNTLDSIAQFNINLVAGTYKVIADAPGFDELQEDVVVTEETNQKHTIYLVKNNEIADAIGNQSEASKAVINALLKDTIAPSIFANGNKLYFNMAPIYFDFDQWEIREDSKKILNELAQKLAKYPTLKIRINSHTDTRGTDMYNQVLSEKRGQSTRDFIAKAANIDLDRLSFRGYGESRPITNCGDFCTEAQHQQNRRSEFEIIEY